MIENERPVIANSLWSATANPSPACPPLSGDVTADVAIVGGGFTGLSAALHLAEAGQQVVLLESETPGWGASGRNGGQVNPGLKESPNEIEARFGPDMGPRMVRMAGEAASLVFSLIERHGIDCAPVRAGWIRAAHDASSLADLRALAAQWQQRGAPVRTLGPDDMAALLGTDAYQGGLIDDRGGNLHPLNYALGLAGAAQRAGAHLHGHSRALRLSRAQDRHRIETAHGSVTAAQVLLCTNGYTDGLMPPLAQSVIPVRSVQVATEPLGDNLARSILPERQAPSDMRRLLLYFRMDDRGRFIMGGRGTYRDGSTARQLDVLRAASAQLYPQLADVRWDYAWGGDLAVTPDHYPHLHQLAPGVMAALGYNGRGVAMATAMGRLLSDWAQGRPEADLDFPVTDVRAIPLHRFHRLGVAARVAQAQVMDRLGW